MVNDPSDNRFTMDEAAAEAEEAEATDSAFAAARFGIAGPDLEQAFGAGAAALSRTANDLVSAAPPSLAAPDAGFVLSLEAQIVESFESRPVHGAWQLPASRFGRGTELVVAGCVAAVIAVGAFLMGASSIWDPQINPVATANAETTTATVATPAARATAPSNPAPIAIGRPAGAESRQSYRDVWSGGPRQHASPASVSDSHRSTPALPEVSRRRSPMSAATPSISRRASLPPGLCRVSDDLVMLQRRSFDLPA